MLLFFILS